jgi:uncharacterized protein GlcG (DUF336 family)
MMIRTALLATLVCVAALQAQLATKTVLTLAAAKKIAAAAQAEAIKNNWTVVVAIVDDGANLIYLEKMDDTQIGSIDIAQAKAKTAVRMKRPSKAMEDIAAQRVGVVALPGILPAEGGLPLAVDGTVIGAIGISGATSVQDAQVARAGVAVLEAMVRK